MVEQISVAGLQELLQKEPSITLIDVREEEEHEVFNIGGINIPLSEIMYKAEQVPRSGKVVLYCKRGIRSAIAIQRLEEKFGYRNLLNLRGGTEEWKETKLTNAKKL